MVAVASALTWAWLASERARDEQQRRQRAMLQVDSLGESAAQMGGNPLWARHWPVEWSALRKEIVDARAAVAAAPSGAALELAEQRVQRASDERRKLQARLKDLVDAGLQRRCPRHPGRPRRPSDAACPVDGSAFPFWQRGNLIYWKEPDGRLLALRPVETETGRDFDFIDFSKEALRKRSR